MARNPKAARKLGPLHLVAASVLIASFALDGPVRKVQDVVLAVILERVLLSISHLGDPVSLAAAVVILLTCGLVARRPKLARAPGVLGAAVVATGVAMVWLKWLGSRSEDGVFHGFWAGQRGIMFPSGHTAMAFAACAVIGTLWRKARWPACVIATGVAVSRVILVHFLSDVVAGALVGVLVGRLVTGWAAKKGFLDLDSDPRAGRSPAPGRPSQGG